MNLQSSLYLIVADELRYLDDPEIALCVMEGETFIRAEPTDIENP